MIANIFPIPIYDLLSLSRFRKLLKNDCLFGLRAILNSPVCHCRRNSMLLSYIFLSTRRVWIQSSFGVTVIHTALVLPNFSPFRVNTADFPVIPQTPLSFQSCLCRLHQCWTWAHFARPNPIRKYPVLNRTRKLCTTILLLTFKRDKTGIVKRS